MDGYKAPRVPQIVAKNISFSTKHDTQLRDVQERCAEITRPVHFFYHEFHKLQQANERNPGTIDLTAILEVASDFAILMHRHLGSLAVKVHDTRMANIRAAAGATFEDDSLRMFDPQTLHDHVKSVRTLQSVFRKRDSDNHRDKGGNNNQGNNNNNNSHGYSSHSNNGNWRNNQDRRSRSRSRRDYSNSNNNNNNNSRSSSGFQRNPGQRRGNSQQRGRSSSRRGDRSPESVAGYNNS